MHAWLKRISLTAAILLLAGTGAAHARDVTIGCSGQTIAEMPFVWASRKGFFKEAYLDVTLIYMSTRIAAKGLMSGDVDYSAAMGGTLRAAIVAAPVIGIDSMFKAQMRLVAQVKYKKVADLKAKTVVDRQVVSSWGSGAETHHS